MFKIDEHSAGFCRSPHHSIQCYPSMPIFNTLTANHGEVCRVLNIDNTTTSRFGSGCYLPTKCRPAGWGQDDVMQSSESPINDQPEQIEKKVFVKVMMVRSENLKKFPTIGDPDSNAHNSSAHIDYKVDNGDNCRTQRLHFKHHGGKSSLGHLSPVWYCCLSSGTQNTSGKTYTISTISAQSHLYGKLIFTITYTNGVKHLATKEVQFNLLMYVLPSLRV